MSQPYPSPAAKFDMKELEEGVLAFWDRADIFEKLRTKNADGAPWSFIDGPITANNPMGIHHAWGRSLKDAFERYHAMNGRSLRYQNGFDCQGLWVEVEVEKELGFTSKRDIEEYGIDRFVERCKQRVLRYADIITAQSKRLGYWMDWNDSYFTMSEENNYTIWSFLKKCHDRDLLYRGHDVMPWCPRCGTGISQHEMSEGYAEVTHLALYVALPIRGRPGEHLVVWTTTPWTLPANVAAAVNPEVSYAAVSDGHETFYVGAERAGLVATMLGRRSAGARVPGRFEIRRRLTGAELLAMELSYDGPFDHLTAAADARQAHRIIPWDEVAAEEGTGLVHVAPGCGEEDNALGRAFDLPAPAPVDESGRFLPGYGELAGRAAGEVGEDIAADLERRRRLVGRERYTHSYPHCWRCGRELIYRLVDEWYIAMDPWRDEITNLVKQIRWIPSYGKDLELDWLSNMRDWMISKKRYWGLALPIWVSDDGSRFEVIGSREELERRAVEGWEEFDGHTPHRPWIDAVKIAGPDGSVLTRVPDVGNPWLDAGIVPYSTTKYNTDRDYWERWVPADLVLESFPGQFRNWFYSLLAMSTMMEGIPPFKALVGHAQVRDEHGEEMHKSKGNAIWFDDAVDRVGSDVLRWLFLSHDIRNNLNFSFDDASSIRGRVFATLWNSHAFFVNYARTVAFDPDREAPPVSRRTVLDRWILAELATVVSDSREAFERYDIRAAVRGIEAFVDSLSNWYIRHSRRRFWRGEGRDESAAFHTLYECLETVCRLIAPIVPMLAEAMYRNLTAASESAPESVHLAEYPLIDEATSGADELSEQMQVVIDTTTAALRARKQAGIRIRQPLSRLAVGLSTAAEVGAVEMMSGLITGEVNVKELDLRPPTEKRPTIRVGELDLRRVGPKFGPKTTALVQAFNANADRVVGEIEGGAGSAVLTVEGEPLTLSAEDLTFREVVPDHLSVADVRDGWVALDTRIDRALELEGLVRELVRRVQIQRRDAGLSVEDRIVLHYATEDHDLREAIESHRDYLAGELLVVEIEAFATTTAASDRRQPAGGEPVSEFDIGGRPLRVGISRTSGD